MTDSKPWGKSRALRWASWGGLLLVLLLTSAVRWRLLDAPLERDEGEYAYAAQLMLEGIAPYGQVYSMKLPGIYAVYALILETLGHTHSSIHLGLLLVNAATVLAVFLLARRFLDDPSSLLAGASFALLSVHPSVQGVFANAEHFVILLAIGGLALLLRSLDTGRTLTLALAGVLLGLALLVKQHGAVFAALGGVYLLIRELRSPRGGWRRPATRCSIFALGVAVPYVFTCLLLWRAGVFDRFWFWTVTYAASYAQQVPLAHAPGLFLGSASKISLAMPVICVLAAFGLVETTCARQVHRHRLFLLLLFSFSVLGVCPGFFFRPHYFILLLPSVALLSGLGGAMLGRLGARGRHSSRAQGLTLAIATICVAVSVIHQREFLFTMSPLEVTRSTYPGNPFPESLEIAKLIDEVTTNGGRVAVIGSEPQIYFYTGRQGATGYVYTYELMQSHAWTLEMQEEMIREIESIEPELVVFVNVVYSWLPTPVSQSRVFDWFERYSRDLSLIAVAPVGTGEPRVYRGREITDPIRDSAPSLRLYQRSF